MRRRISTITSIADRIGSFRWQTGGTKYFHLELASRHRPYLAPLRVLLKATTVGLIVWACWSTAEALLAFQGLHETEARLNQARMQDQQLIDEARKLVREGFMGMYVARYMNTGPPRWRFVTSGAYVFRRAAGARSTLVSQFRSPAGGGFGPARRIRLGHEGWVRTSSAIDTGTIVFWRHGRVLAFVVCSHMTRLRALAEELARKQERRMASRLG